MGQLHIKAGIVHADQHIRLAFGHQPQRFHAVSCRADNLDAVLLLQILGDHVPELYIVIRNNYTYCIHSGNLL